MPSHVVDKVLAQPRHQAQGFHVGPERMVVLRREEGDAGIVTILPDQREGFRQQLDASEGVGLLPPGFQPEAALVILEEVLPGDAYRIGIGGGRVKRGEGEGPGGGGAIRKKREEDAVAGYGLGADDYVRKPFGAAELRAKVAAHLRRERRPRSHALSFGEVRIDLGARGLAVGGEAVPLGPAGYAICESLARRPGQVMSRAQIREAVLGWESDADDAAISMQVSRARRKLSEAGADPIATVWGMGYKWQL